MKPAKIAAALLGAAAIAGTGLASAAEKGKFDFGKREYDSNCAVCHGKQGKGDGPYAGLIDTKIADLTTLSKRNKGVFPYARVQELVDGRQVVKAHGPRDMPIWGARYLAGANEWYQDVPYDPEAFVRARIIALTEYLYRVQAK